MSQKINTAYLEHHAHTSQYTNCQSFVPLNPGDCCCAPPLDAASSQNGYLTIEDLMCLLLRMEEFSCSEMHLDNADITISSGDDGWVLNE
jgi:hypothetical protein